MKKLQKITPGAMLIMYVTKANPVAVVDLLRNAGYNQVPKNYFQAIYMLNDYVKKDGEEAMKQIAMIHPDRDLIETYCKSETLNTDGPCYGCDASYMNFTGWTENNINKLIIAGAGIIGLGLITSILINK